MASSANSAPSNGITGGYTGHDLGLQIAMGTFIGIAWYNAIELIALIFVTFRNYRGLYFWSLLISSAFGVVPYSVGFLIKFFQLTSATWLSVTLLTVGWYAMVTGQSMVLYSRLHLLNRNPKVLRPVLYMIIIDAIVLHTPTTVLTYGSNFASSNHHYVDGYNVMEKIQMTGFCLQEFILSGIYIYETIVLLRANPERGRRKIMYQLIAINLIIILMDIALLVVEYKNIYVIETTLKGAIYSIKLKLEFAVLGQLIRLVRTHSWKPQSVIPGAINGIDGLNIINDDALPDFVDATRVTSDLTHATSLPHSGSHHRPFDDMDDISIAMFEHSTPLQDQEGIPDMREIRPQPTNLTEKTWSGEMRENDNANGGNHQILDSETVDFADEAHTNTRNSAYDQGRYLSIRLSNDHRPG